MNWSMGAPEPVAGDTIWLRCPYQAELCGTDAASTVVEVSHDEVTMVTECINGHRWRISRLSDGTGGSP